MTPARETSLTHPESEGIPMWGQGFGPAAGLPPGAAAQGSPDPVFNADYYEILRVCPHADDETIERVYGTLSDRFHPDNPATGDSATFLRLQEAYETLSDKARRAEYNVVRRYTRGSVRFWLRGRDFFDGVRGGQNRRLALLCLLYRQRIGAYEFPGLTILDLEQLTGCTREELTSALWYLCEKKWASIGETTEYSITAEGFDVVESRLEDRMEFRALATVSYYATSSDPEDPVHNPGRSRDSGSFPFDIGRFLTSDGETPVADHYEALGIGPGADDETIERVYRTLEGRYHPENPRSGDEESYRRINEAWETLSDPARRAAYDTLREHTNRSSRFRLRGREFFDGIRGEQLRRLAVLFLCYRQAASELPGLTVLDLEQATGCTREELGSALWYLREKKWVRFGEFSEYTITGEGFDVVESKMEDRKVAGGRDWGAQELSEPVPAIEDVPGAGEKVGASRGLVLIQQAFGLAGQAGRSTDDADPATLMERNGNARPDTEDAAPSGEKVEVTEMPIPVEEAIAIEEPPGGIGESATTEESEEQVSWDWLMSGEIQTALSGGSTAAANPSARIADLRPAETP
ncbi:MAG: DnaJ domain-containing protein, partial [Acidobacteriota bacterium]|nr:DnaJ domain-containing protein [Acidobacteriota bacterium]